MPLCFTIDIALNFHLHVELNEDRRNEKNERSRGLKHFNNSA